MALRLSGEGVLAVAELRGDDVPPVRTDGGAETVRADEGHIRSGKAAAIRSACVSIADQAVNAAGVLLLLGSGFRTHGGDVSPDSFHILNGDGYGVDILRLGGRVAALYRDHAGSLFVGGEAVHELLAVPAAGGVLLEVEGIKNALTFIPSRLSSPSVL